MIDESLARSKKELLLHYLGKFDSLLVAFSGGVDSSFLLASAQQALGDRVAAVTATSSIHPRRERDETRKFTREREINHIIFKSDETKIPEFLSNGPDRCYHCKKGAFQRVLARGQREGH